MATKHTSECLKNAADDEPIFVLRAQDCIADMLVDCWAKCMQNDLGEDHPKVIGAKKVAAEMRAWKFRKISD